MEQAVAKMFLCQALFPEGFCLGLATGILTAGARSQACSYLACTFLLGDRFLPFFLTVLTTSVTIWNILCSSHSLARPPICSLHDAFKIGDTSD